MNKIKVGIIGGAGYTGGELIRILLQHPMVEISFVHSNSNAGNYLYDVHADLLGATNLKFTGTLSEDMDVLFLCLGHGDSVKFLNENSIHDMVKIIDLSQDFRSGQAGFVYGLPELNKCRIEQAQKIANPGCFATCIQLALLPLAQQKIIKSNVHISAITGATGAGQGLNRSTHFSWRSNNISTYKVFTHQHLIEINQSIQSLQPGFSDKILFVPFRGNFTRGIFATTYLKSNLSIAEAVALFENYYQPHPFVLISKSNPDLKQVINTNNCVLYLEQHGDLLFIVSIIDNLLKGASGQAVQNMNLMFGIEEITGLKLKAIAF